MTCRGKKSIECPARRSARASQDRLHCHVAWQPQDAAGDAGADRSRFRVDLGGDLNAAAQRGAAVGLQERRGLDRITLEPGTGGGARNRRQDDCRQQADNGKHADDLDQGKPRFAAAAFTAPVINACR
jgi:hypothetical protein